MQVKIDIITCFLEAGKTTLIKILQQEDNKAALGDSNGDFVQ
jgi:G3E family GTPase